MKTKRHLYYLFSDAVIITFSFVFVSILKPATLRYYIPNYSVPFLGFLLIWIAVSLLSKKYTLQDGKRLRTQIAGILKIDFIILAIVFMLLYVFQQFHYSRFIVLGTILVSTFIEIFFVSTYYFLITKAITYYEAENEEIIQKDLVREEEKEPVIIDDTSKEISIDFNVLSKLENIIIEESSEVVYDFISNISGFCKDYCTVLSTTNILNIYFLPNEFYTTIINLKRINDIRRINKFFEAVNTKLSNDSLFICCVETFELRKKRILNKLPSIINYIYYIFDFIITRIFPKLPVTKQVYFYFTKGNNQVLSKAETFGRLYSCGFKVLTEQFINERLYVVAKKIKEPVYDNHPTHGLFIKLKRCGKNGKLIKLYKIRTMHPYAEYLQDYVYENNNLQEGGKFKDDFRRNTLGKIMRRFWIDEIPSVINLIKGDLKLVGVRPLSLHYLNLYSEELKQKRKKYKPGLIPPHYANLPKTLDETMESELKYLKEYEKHPVRTNTKYFFKVIYNIIFKGVRSN